MTEIDVRCEAVTDGWRCRVRVADATGTSTFDVSIGDLGPFLPSVLPSPGLTEVERLVRATFEFLLEREPRSAILTAFDLSEVTRYFPEYPAVIRARLAR